VIIIKQQSLELGQVLAKGVCEGGLLYRLIANLVKHGASVHASDELRELWQKRFDQLHYRALPLLKDIVQGLPYKKINKTWGGFTRVVHLENMPRLFYQAVSTNKDRLLI
jgi:FixJ family two-component response regulator